MMHLPALPAVAIARGWLRHLLFVLWTGLGSHLHDDLHHLGCGRKVGLPGEIVRHSRQLLRVFLDDSRSVPKSLDHSGYVLLMEQRIQKMVVRFWCPGLCFDGQAELLYRARMIAVC